LWSAANKTGSQPPPPPPRFKEPNLLAQKVSASDSFNDEKIRNVSWFIMNLFTGTIPIFRTGSEDNNCILPKSSA
jgi:hypothetical protein